MFIGDQQQGATFYFVFDALRIKVTTYHQCAFFYSASALLAMQSAVLARGILSVRHVPVLRRDE